MPIQGLEALLSQPITSRQEGRSVSAFLMNGEKVRGKFRSFYQNEAKLSILTEPEGEVAEIPFPKLRLLEFSDPLQPDEVSEFLQLRSIQSDLPSPPNSFIVNYVDEQKLTGDSPCLIHSGSGLHLLKTKENKVTQAFIPMAVVRDYQPNFRIGEALVEEKKIAPADADEAIKIQQKLRGKKLGEYLSPLLESDELKKVLDQQDNYPSTYRLGELLVSEGVINDKQLKEALAIQKSDRNKRVGDVLVEMGAISNEVLNTALAKRLGIPFIKLRNFAIDPEALSLVSIQQARKHHVIPCLLHHGNLVIATDNPMGVEALNMLRFTTGMNILVVMAMREDIEWAFDNYYSTSKLLIDMDDAEDSGKKETELSLSEIERMGQEKPIVKFVHDTILDAIRRRASDIHIHPGRNHVALLFRIDGTLINIQNFSKNLLPGIVSRIKILGRMDISDRRLPQDGSARVIYEGKVVDQRISIIPTVDGESVVIRILNTDVGLKSVSELGFGPRDERIFTDMLHKSYGIILVTGPTGSGKSTTLYAALGEIIKQNVNVITVEDPVEYHIDKVEQIQVNTVTGFTFAKALRHILRHDPDVIMIGEIRDQETGKIAIESALTGHVVLSTLHTNTASGAYTRLMEMGIEDYFLSSSVLGVLAQRLVRRNCPHCMVEEEVVPIMREMLKVSPDETFFMGKGCDHCNHSGYSGRIAVYELLLTTPALRELIKSGVTDETIRQQGIKDGMIPLTENALSQARLRKTSLSEVYRIRLE